MSIIPVHIHGGGWLCGKFHQFLSYFLSITILMSNKTQVQLWLSWGCDNIGMQSKASPECGTAQTRLLYIFVSWLKQKHLFCIDPILGSIGCTVQARMCRDQASLSMHMETWSLERCGRQKEDLYSGKHSQPCSKTSYVRIILPISRETWTLKWYTRQIQFLLLHVRIVTQTKPDSCHHWAGVWNLLKDQEGDEWCSFTWSWWVWR